MPFIAYSFVADGRNRTRGPIGAIHIDQDERDPRDAVREILRQVDEMRRQKREETKRKSRHRKPRQKKSLRQLKAEFNQETFLAILAGVRLLQEEKAIKLKKGVRNVD